MTLLHHTSIVIERGFKKVHSIYSKFSLEAQYVKLTLQELSTGWDSLVISPEIMQLKNTGTELKWIKPYLNQCKSGEQLQHSRCLQQKMKLRAQKISDALGFKCFYSVNPSRAILADRRLFLLLRVERSVIREDKCLYFKRMRVKFSVSKKYFWDGEVLIDFPLFVTPAGCSWFKVGRWEA